MIHNGIKYHACSEKRSWRAIIKLTNVVLTRLGNLNRTSVSDLVKYQGLPTEDEQIYNLSTKFTINMYFNQHLFLNEERTGPGSVCSK